MTDGTNDRGDQRWSLVSEGRRSVRAARAVPRLRAACPGAEPATDDPIVGDVGTLLAGAEAMPRNAESGIGR